MRKAGKEKPLKYIAFLRGPALPGQPPGQQLLSHLPAEGLTRRPCFRRVQRWQESSSQGLSTNRGTTEKERRRAVHGQLRPPWSSWQSSDIGSSFLKIFFIGLPGWYSGKESACRCRGLSFHRCVGNLPWSRKWQPTPVFLLGKFHGQRSQGGYSP